MHLNTQCIRHEQNDSKWGLIKSRINVHIWYLILVLLTEFKRESFRNGNELGQENAIDYTVSGSYLLLFVFVLTTHLLSIERADWSKQLDVFKAYDAKIRQREFPVGFPV